MLGASHQSYSRLPSGLGPPGGGGSSPCEQRKRIARKDVANRAGPRPVHLGVRRAGGAEGARAVGAGGIELVEALRRVCWERDEHVNFRTRG